MARLVAFVVALAVGIGGSLPRWTAYRCAMTGALDSESCCDRQPAPERTIGGLCCDALQSPAAGERMAPKAVESNIAPAPFAGLVSSPPLAILASSSSARIAGAPPPPIRSVLQLGAVLRI